VKERRRACVFVCVRAAERTREREGESTLKSEKGRACALGKWGKKNFGIKISR